MINLRLKTAGEPSQMASQQRQFLTGGSGGIRTHEPGNPVRVSNPLQLTTMRRFLL